MCSRPLLRFTWYQGVVGQLAAHVQSRKEADAAAHIRRLISGDVSPTTPEIVEELEAMAPGARALLDKLGAGYRSRDKQHGGTGVPLEDQSGHTRQMPRFESGPCPFEREAWADAVTLACGRLVVPESRARPAGRTLRLAGDFLLRGPLFNGLPVSRPWRRAHVRCRTASRRAIAVEPRNRPERRGPVPRFEVGPCPFARGA